MTEFAKNLREAVAYTNRQLRGTEPAPWEVVMEALILVEERLTELRKEFEEFKAVQWPL